MVEWLSPVVRAISVRETPLARQRPTAPSTEILPAQIVVSDPGCHSLSSPAAVGTGAQRGAIDVDMNGKVSH